MSTANSHSIPDLWPQEIVFTPVLSPLTILRHQAELLAEKSLGVLKAEVVTGGADKVVFHEFRLVAPSLDNYSRPLLIVRHDMDLPYPCSVLSDAFEQDHHDVDSPDQLMRSVARALSSGVTRSLINSLLARISEQADVK